MELWLHKQAEYEFDEACEFYEQRRPGLGKRFRAAVVEPLREIVNDPDRLACSRAFSEMFGPDFSLQNLL